MVQALEWEGTLARVTAAGAGVVFAAVGAGVGAVVGVILWALGPLLDLLPIGRN